MSYPENVLKGKECVVLGEMCGVSVQQENGFLSQSREEQFPYVTLLNSLSFIAYRIGLSPVCVFSL